MHYNFKPEWITAIVAFLAFSISIYEFYFRVRPYLKMEIEVRENKDSKKGFEFLGKVINFGKVPARFWINAMDIKIKIGDEEYFGAKDIKNIYSFPEDNQPPFFVIGEVYETGIKKLIKKEYKDNTAHIDISVNYQSPHFKWITHKLNFKYGIHFSDGSNEKPRVTVFVLNQYFS